MLESYSSQDMFDDSFYVTIRGSDSCIKIEYKIKNELLLIHSTQKILFLILISSISFKHVVTGPAAKESMTKAFETINNRLFHNTIVKISINVKI